MIQRRLQKLTKTEADQFIKYLLTGLHPYRSIYSCIFNQRRDGRQNSQTIHVIWYKHVQIVHKGTEADQFTKYLSIGLHLDRSIYSCIFNQRRDGQQNSQTIHVIWYKHVQIVHNETEADQFTKYLSIGLHLDRSIYSCIFNQRRDGQQNSQTIHVIWYKHVQIVHKETEADQFTKYLSTGLHLDRNT